MTTARWRIVLWVTAAIAVCWVAFAARQALVPFAVGAAVGYALLPIVERLDRLLPIPGHEAVRRGIAVFIVYLVVGGIVVFAFSLLAPIVVSQVATFVQTLPDRIDSLSALLSQWLAEVRQRVPASTQLRVDSYLQSLTTSLTGALSDWAKSSVNLVTGTVSILFGYFVVPFWLFYMLRDRYALQRGFIGAVPPVLRDDVRYAFVMIDYVIGRYIRAQLLLGLIVGLAVGISLSLLGVQLAAGLAVWAGVTELIPIIGPWIGAVPGLIIIAGTNPHLLIPVALVYLAVQQLENQLLVPRVQGQATEISAGIVILLLVVAGAAFGFGGLVIAVPSAAILRELFWYLDRRLSAATPAEAYTASRAARDRPLLNPPQNEIQLAALAGAGSEESKR